MKPRIPKGLPQPVRKERAGMSESHLAMIRLLPCCICGTHPAQPHHLLRTGEHGMGKKSSDRWAINLCVTHHDGLHRNGNEEDYLMGFGLDGRAFATALWAARGDLDAIARVAFRFRQEAERKRRAA